MRLFLLLSLLSAASPSVLDTHTSVSIMSGENYCYSGRVESTESCPEYAASNGVAYPVTRLSDGDSVTLTINGLELTDEGRKRSYDDDDDETDDRRIQAADSEFTVQIYLMPATVPIVVDTAACCWELLDSSCDTLSSFSPTVLPSSCSVPPPSACFVRQSPFTDPATLVSTPPVSTNSADYASVIVALNAPPLAEPLQITLRPPIPDANYYVYVSNCALIHADGQDRKTTALNMATLTLAWNFNKGTLGALKPLVTFYSLTFTFYALLAILWARRSMQFYGDLLGLQKAISLLVYCECAFSLVALLYYIHLDNSDVDLNVLYSGTFAALEKWDFWSFLVTVTHFSTIFACQVVVTLVADGKWLIQHSMRKSTKVAVIVLACLWTILVLFYSAMTAETRRGWAVFSGVVWLLWLLVSVR